jgi:hypothetical protein
MKELLEEKTFSKKKRLIIKTNKEMIVISMESQEIFQKIVPPKKSKLESLYGAVEDFNENWDYI